MSCLNTIIVFAVFLFSMNASATYVGGNPMSETDPSGLCPQCAAIGLGVALLINSTPTDTSNASRDEVIDGAITIGTFGLFEGMPFLLNNRYIRVGQGKFPEPFSKRISIGNTPGNKFEIGVSRTGRIDVKLGSARKTIRSATRACTPEE